MKFPRGKSILVDQIETQNKGQQYVFYKRGRDQNAPNQGFLLYSDTKDSEDAILFFYFDKREAQVLEALLGSENKTDKEALHKFIAEMYAEEKKGLTDHIFNKLFSPLEDIYYGKNKLATLRKKIAHGIDETLGTNFEEKRLPKILKIKVEEPLSRIIENKLSNKKIKD